MSGEGIDPLIENELVEALDVAPSSNFEAGIRRSIERNGADARWSVWSVAAAGAVVLGLAASIGLFSSQREDGRSPEPRVASDRVLREAAPSVTTAPAARTLRPARPSPAARIAPRLEDRPVEPEVFVSPDQQMALEQLKAALMRGRLDASVLPEPPIDSSAELTPETMAMPTWSIGSDGQTDLLQKFENPVRFAG